MNIQGVEVATDADFLINAWNLHGLTDALDQLQNTNIPHECNTSACFLLMRKAASGDDASNKAFGFAITQAAKQARSSITKKPKYKRMIDDIYHDRKRAKGIKASLYKALYPFAKKVYETHSMVPEPNYDCDM